MIMLAALLSVALADSVARSVPLAGARGETRVLVHVIRAAEVRGGRTDAPHQRRSGVSPEGAAMSLIEFE